MKIEKVSYGKTYALGNYCSERIDLEASLDENEGMHETILRLKHHCDEIHKEANPHLYQEQTPLTYAPEKPLQVIPIHYESTKYEEKISPEQEIENTISEIENATTETLHTFQLQAAKNVKTMGPYNRRKKQLNIN